MIKYQGYSKFFSRNSNGKYQLDYNEIKYLFSNSLTLSDQVKNFRTERIINIKNGDVPNYSINQYEPNIILHLIPLQNILEGKTIDLRKIQSSDYGLKTIDTNSIRRINFNFDGFFIVNQFKDYAQVFVMELLNSFGMLYFNHIKTIQIISRL